MHSRDWRSPSTCWATGPGLAEQQQAERQRQLGPSSAAARCRSEWGEGTHAEGVLWLVRVHVKLGVRVEEAVGHRRRRTGGAVGRKRDSGNISIRKSIRVRPMTRRTHLPLRAPG